MIDYEDMELEQLARLVAERQASHDEAKEELDEARDALLRRLMAEGVKGVDLPSLGIGYAWREKKNYDDRSVPVLQWKAVNPVTGEVAEGEGEEELKEFRKQMTKACRLAGISPQKGSTTYLQRTNL